MNPIFARFFQVLLTTFLVVPAFGFEDVFSGYENTSFESASARRFELRVMSYNINGLPWPIKANKAPLFKEMARIINEQRATDTHPHIIVVQEGFRKNVSHFVKNSGYKYVVKGPNTRLARSEDEPSRAIMNAGLYIMSDFPIVKSEMMVFGRACAGLDCFANKGVVYAQIDVPNVGLVDVFNTHMNSVKSAEVAEHKVFAAQRKQLQLAMQFVNERISADRLALFSGDFNVRIEHETFPDMIGLLNPFHHTGRFCQAYARYCRLGERTNIEDLFSTPDHHFYKDSADMQIYPTFAAKTMREKLGDRDLSDHPALVVHFAIH